MAADRAASPSAATSTQPASETDRERGQGPAGGKGICMLEQAASEMGNAIAIDDGGLSQC